MGKMVTSAGESGFAIHTIMPAMPKACLPAFLLLALAGCAAPSLGAGPAWPWLQPATASAPPYAHFNFEWRLAGDPQIMPLQVFDDGERMWLQFPEGGAWPAVFQVSDHGWRPLAFQRQGPYMVVDGVYSQLALRGGHLHGTVKRAPAAPPADGPVPAASPAAPGGMATPMPVSALAAPLAPAAASSPTPAPAPAPTPTPTLAPAPAPVRAPDTAAVSTLVPALQPVPASVPGTGLTEGPQIAPPVASDTAAPAADLLGPPVGQYSVSPADGTIRQGLERWAGMAGWAFSAEHWAVDVDIPLVGEARFETDFKSAVRELLAATEMGDRPLQPCFYSNRVLRVVPFAQPCDRRNGMGKAS